MEQFEQLLTCAICLDRYRNPKLLPCQHSFCMEPCMDGLVDYVRRQVKCPECRAEHRIPYQGVQGYPTNVTLQRFLELHIEITGELPDPTTGQIMERCNVCSEKSYCSLCVHCEKKICAECKEAHMEILRREISRINNQIRRAIHRLQDALSAVDRNAIGLQSNCATVAEEVEEVHRRLTKAVKDRTEFLRSELERYLTTEQRNLATLRDHLELEVANIQSNCDLADKHMADDGVDWDDAELVDAKEIFLRTVEFIRNFDYEPGDYSRRVRFIMSVDPNQLVLNVGSYGELNIHMPTPFSGVSGMSQGTAAPGGGLLQPPAAPGLMRSKSDHRLASQFNRQEERGGGGWKDEEDEKPGRRLSPLAGRKFGERYAQRDRFGGDSRYGRGTGGSSEYGGNEFDYGGEEGGRRSRFRSRFARHQDQDSDHEHNSGRNVRFSEAEAAAAAAARKERERVFDTEDATKGPLSGITRLYDSPRVMKRLQESELKEKKKTKEPVAPQPVQGKTPPVFGAKKAHRQVSEEDEISKIKKQNKNADPSPSSAKTNQSAPAQGVGLQRRTSSTVTEESQQDTAAPADTTAGRRSSASEVASSSEESEEEGLPSLQQTRKPDTGGTKTSRRSSASSEHSTTTAPSGEDKTAGKPSERFQTRSASSDSSGSESSASSSAVKSAVTTEDSKKKLRASQESSTSTKPSADASSNASTARSRANATASEKKEGTTTPSRFQSRFLPRASTPAAAEPTKEESESSSESEDSDSDEDSDDDTATKTQTSTSASKAKDEENIDKSDIGPLLARSANARESPTSSTYGKAKSSPSSGNNSTSPYASRYGNRDDSSTTGSSNSKYLSRTRTAQEEEPPSSRYGSGYTSRFLNKSKSSAALSPEEDEGGSSRYSTNSNADDKYPSGRSRLAAIKDRRSRLARSKSSHNFGQDEDEEPNERISSTPSSTVSASSTPGSSYLSRYGTGSDLSRSRSTHALKSRENSPERSATSNSVAGGEKDGAALSSWARYLKNKYGSRAKDKDSSLGGSTGGSSSTAASSAAAARRLSLGLPLRNSSIESSDDDQKNTPTSPTSPTAAGFGNIPRNQYLQKRRQLFKIGSRGSEPGCFTWPRGIAVGPDNSIVVADSSNHRVQVFDANGIFVKEFGSYGSAEGEFDCLAGVAVNRIGQFIIADRYNHRIQVLDPSGRFLRAFGSQGAADGRFNYPWGVTTDALGFIYVCDKENHRVQVFQSDGTFVGKFGSMGNRPGQLEHPHYVAVSSTNRVIVSDSNNHRVQIFDVNGRVLTTFGSEGSEEGQFKFPRGVAVDDQGYIFVGDSGNNRIQIFHPDGAFLRAFGCWGSGDGEFKGLEGVAVMPNGNILVCDRENHRVQVF